MTSVIGFVPGDDLAGQLLAASATHSSQIQVLNEEDVSTSSLSILRGKDIEWGPDAAGSPPVAPLSCRPRVDQSVVTTIVTEADRDSLPLLLSALRITLDHRPDLVLRTVVTSRPLLGFARRLADSLGVHGHSETVELTLEAAETLLAGSAALIHTSDVVLAAHHAAWADDRGLPWCRFGVASIATETHPMPLDVTTISEWLTSPTTNSNQNLTRGDWKTMTAHLGSQRQQSVPSTTRRWSGEDHLVRNDVLEPEHIDYNIALCSAALTSAGIDHIWVSPRHEPGRLATPAHNAKGVTEALQAITHAEPVMIEALNSTGRTLHKGSPATVQLAPGTVAFRLYAPVLTTGTTVRYGPTLGCTVELWQPETTRAGYASPLAPTKRGPILTSLTPDATVTLGGVEIPTRNFHLIQSVDDVRFPIDAVWTWVDGSDQAWRSERARWSERTSSISSDGDADNRYESHDELRYSLRSTAMYAPWLRHRYIVTAGQRPAWLTESDKVTVIDHRDIMPADVLPTFNSHAIENHLHRISGLSENFLYFNDDVFLGRRCTPEQFFTPAGQPRAFSSPTGVPEGPVGDDDYGYYAARKNNRSLVERQFQITVPHGYRHTPHSLNRNLLDQIQELFPDEWDATSRSRFRSNDDLAVVSALHHDVGRILGLVVEGSVRTKHVSLGSETAFDDLRDIAARRHLDVFCLNAGQGASADPDQTAHALIAFMAGYFPVAASWESQ